MNNRKSISLNRAAKETKKKIKNKIVQNRNNHTESERNAWLAQSMSYETEFWSKNK